MAEKWWYAVRCVFEIDGPGEPHTYEERITPWHAGSSDHAMDLAEADAVECAGAEGDTYLGWAQSYQLEGPPVHGAEVFSRVRDSNLEPDDHLVPSSTLGMRVRAPPGKRTISAYRTLTLQ